MILLLFEHHLKYMIRVEQIIMLQNSLIPFVIFPL